MHDFRDAVRSLRSTPVVSLIAILSLALGIGANTAIFSIVDSLFLRTLPVRDPHQLVIVRDATGRRTFWSNPMWEQIRERERFFDGAFAWADARFNLARSGHAEIVDGLWVSGRMFDLLGVGIEHLMQVKYLVPLFIGTLAGVVGGALPGVTITMTIIVVLPFTFGLDPLQGLAAMTGVYVGGSAGGLVTAVLLGLPGTPSAIATTFDGHVMAKKGEPGRAVWLGIWSSFFGGLIGGVFLIAATGPLARIALEFGPWEFFSLFILALSMVAGLVESSLIKGLIAGALGCVVTILGTDPVMGQERLGLGPAVPGRRRGWRGGAGGEGPRAALRGGDHPARPAARHVQAAVQRSLPALSIR